MKDIKKITIFLYSIVFCAIVATCIPQTAKAAETNILIDRINFPDEKFREYIENTLDKDHDAHLSEDEIKETKEIKATYLGISNLKGIEYFTALTNLYCPNNEISALDLSHNIALTELVCGVNKLSSLDLSHNTALTKLNCSDNGLSSLDLSHNTALTELVCVNNKLSSLDLSHNTALTWLSCVNNKLSSLDLSQCADLTTLLCYSNPLSVLNFNSKTYGKIEHYEVHNEGDVLSDLQNLTKAVPPEVIDITKPATYKVNGKNFIIMYTPDATPETPAIPQSTHIFSDYGYNNPLSGSAIVIYGNGANITTDGKKVNNKVFTAYTDILASYKYTVNNRGAVNPSVGKVIAGITKSAIKPPVNKNKITDTSASNIAKAKIRNGQITVTAIGKEGGLVYLWVIDTGSKNVSACYPIDVKLAPKKLELQDTSENKITNTSLKYGEKDFYVHVAGIVQNTVKTDDCTYTAVIDPKYQNYITVTPIAGSKDKFMINATGLKNNKNTKAVVIFTCDQNNKKIKLSLTITS